MEKRYPGIGIIGHEHISALYGVDNGIVDWQGTGIQHFFYGSFDEDLIHSATSYIQHYSGQIEMGNRLIRQETHPVHQQPVASVVEDGFCYSTTFESQVNKDLSWTERVYATHEDQIVFETTIQNNGENKHSLMVGGYAILRNPSYQKLSYENQVLSWENKQTRLDILGEHVEEIRFYKESPTGFVYRTLQQIFNVKDSDPIEAFSNDSMIGVVTQRRIEVEANQSITFKWMIQASFSKIISNRNVNWNTILETARVNWKDWLNTGALSIDQLPGDLKSVVQTNLIALKASLLDGFVPADMTGHYYSDGSPSYYARDALMIAKAFIMAGYYSEAKSIIVYAASRKTKDNKGEFFQRYNAVGEPSEGANNNVFHQLDSQGYFLYLVEKYYERTGEWAVSFKKIKQVANVLFDFKRKGGLIGPEGGVNEGVFGPAYITSSNMFIAGGLFAASRIAILHEDLIHEAKWEELANSILNHIENETWISEICRYGYGYVEYVEELVRKYDSPQFFGPLYGYPISANFKEMVDKSLQNQSFYKYGIGYSEQEYHHGPWIFNTAANAQCQILLNNNENYLLMINWMVNHSNAYGLLPEAIDGNSEELCFINPLTWACAEFISAVSSGQHILTQLEERVR
ncbi:hypothetical protein EJF36_16300 [Bacillus sp. HMF5848]|uniref:hypothetical protein n=1 Tax=Bacillus sp. HMF5848 TaxID=2495421 RepID=UPI000F78B4AE|nr:hypothetical protein [Bacillus sp. HMF5848]RSK28297.1 hypothetical protein EJF36_16300 [Bacillus sp. HMF5848]